MPTSSYMPNVTVEIAFDSGFGTPAASRTWTDVSDYVELAEGITITWGRQDERSQADANQLSLTLDNSDGRFTAERSASPYYPNVKLDRPIRVTADPVDGAASVRFVGYVNEWPVEWDGTSAYAKASITASSRLARLGYTAGLLSVIELAILADSPAEYFTLGEPSEATQANDSSGNAAPPLTLAGDAALPMSFGDATGPGTDSLTAAQFNGGQYLQAPPLGSLVSGAPLTTYSLEAFVALASPPTSEDTVAVQFGDFVLGMNKSSGVPFGKAGATTLSGAVNICDGAVHHLAVTTSGIGSTLYVDGAAVDTGAASGAPGDVTVGSPQAFANESFSGSAAHVALFSTTLSAAQVAAHADAGLSAYVGETTDARLERYATAYAGIPSAEVNAEAGSTTMVHVDTSGKQVVELMRVVETTEGGVLFDGRDGTLTLHNRAHRYNVASAFTLDMGQQHVEADYQPKLDRTYILNDITVANHAGTVTAHKVDTQSRNIDHGPMTAQVETASEDDEEPWQTASWLVFTYKDPRVRVGSCSVNALAAVQFGPPNCAAVLAATVGTKVTVSNHPAQASLSSATYFVEGGTEAYGPESLMLTWNLSPASPWDQTLILSDATRGVLGSYALAY